LFVIFQEVTRVTGVTGVVHYGIILYPLFKITNLQLAKFVGKKNQWVQLIQQKEHYPT